MLADEPLTLPHPPFPVPNKPPLFCGREATCLLAYLPPRFRGHKATCLLAYLPARFCGRKTTCLLAYLPPRFRGRKATCLLTYLPARFCGRKKPMFTCFSIICMIDGGPNCLSPISVAKLILRGDSLYWMGTRGFFFSIFSRCGFVFKCLLTSRLDLVPWSQARIVSKYFWSSR